jgi:hypothetical protein
MRPHRDRRKRQGAQEKAELVRAPPVQLTHVGKRGQADNWQKFRNNLFQDSRENKRAIKNNSALRKNRAFRIKVIRLDVLIYQETPF